MIPRDILAAVSVAVVWGLTFIAIKVGVAETSPLMLSALQVPLRRLSGRPVHPSAERAAVEGRPLWPSARRRAVRPPVHRDPCRLSRRPDLARRPGAGVLHRRAGVAVPARVSAADSGHRRRPRLCRNRRHRVSAARRRKPRAFRARRSRVLLLGLWPMFWPRRPARSTCSPSPSGRASPRPCRSLPFRSRSTERRRSPGSPIRA